MAHTDTTTDTDDAKGPRVETIKDKHVLRVVLHGESDFSNINELEQALQDITLDPARLIDVDLTHLAFADVTTIRHLAAFTGHAKRRGHDVTTSGAHPTLRKVAELLNAGDDLGLN